jgi:ketosteroid isomerase-like protein
MARENVDVVNEAFAAWGRRDSAALRELLDEQAEFRSAFVAGLEGGVYRGHAEIERNFSDIDDLFDDWHSEGQRCLEMSGDVVLALYRIVGRGKGSGVPVDQPVGMVFTLSDGKVVKADGYLDPQDALRAGFEHSFGLFGAADIDAAVANLDPDVEWEHQPGTGAPEEGVYQGREKVRSLLERLREAWDYFSVDVHDVADGGNEFVVDGTIHARGRISDIELEGECQYVVEFRDSKAVRIRFTTRTTPVPSTRGATDVA